MDILRLATAGSVDDGKSTLIGTAAVRLQGDLRGSAGGRRADQQGARRGVHQPRAAHRRPAGRARAGHHDRRGLPLLRDPPAQVHHRRHARSHPVHPQHGHRRLHRRPGHRAGRRPQRADRAEPPARLPDHAAAGAAPACWPVNKMDLVDYSAEVFEQIAEEFTAFAAKLEIADLTFIPISALHGDNVVQRSAATCTGTTGRRCCTTWSTCTSPPTATSSTCGSRCST